MSMTMKHGPRSKRYEHNWTNVDNARDTMLAAMTPEEPQGPFLERFLGSSQFEAFSGGVILANVLLIVIETDARAVESLYESDGEEAVTMSQLAAAQRTLTAVAKVNLVFLAYFGGELLVRLYVHKMSFFFSGWNINDLTVVTLGLIGELASAAIEGSGMENMSLLRSIRMIRLLRLTRILIAFPELYTLVQGLANCLRTLMWAAGLIFLTLTVWSIIAVEYVNPLMPGLIMEGHYDTCGWCTNAFRSVMLSNLTFFQVASGDGWSLLARPLIETYSWTVMMFLSIIFIVNFGMLNLIVAAIVDAAATARENDSESLAKQRNKERDIAWRTFATVCAELDTDKSGQINFKELVRGLEDNPTLKANFGVMGVEVEDLMGIFRLLDQDNSGELSYDEFHSQLYSMKTLEVKTTLFYMRRYMEHLQGQMHLQLEAIQRMKDVVAPDSEGSETSRFHRIFWEVGPREEDLRNGSVAWPDSVESALLEFESAKQSAEEDEDAHEDPHKDFVHQAPLGFEAADHASGAWLSTQGKAVNGAAHVANGEAVEPEVVWKPVAEAGKGFSDLQVRAGSLVGIDLDCTCEKEAEGEDACCRPWQLSQEGIADKGLRSLLASLDDRYAKDAIFEEHSAIAPDDRDTAAI